MAIRSVSMPNHINDYLERKAAQGTNVSRYIVSLIEQDMNKSGINLEQKIKNVIYKMIESGQISVNGNSNNFDEDIINNVNDILDI